ncbi:tetratricopeptide repeat protein [Crenobacter cavernae]|uniref:Tetratricopeptide repeat protein n=1 Tax=Crenobacter cavernae TaxID=2290923 RepID=A0ABY0FFZ4_9NEIS|nr:tetratricopeptide repeat protein [Crenobacter cavernae]RXZ45300.1 hypothetical protein EBB06_00285 [Crenobacter cavernae]
MQANQIDALMKMVGGPRDNALLRFAIGNALVSAGRFADAVPHLEQAVAWQADYSAAWKLLGRACAEAGDAAAAIAAYRRGIEVAEARGDVQAAKEMHVFLRRLEKAAGGG